MPFSFTGTARIKKLESKRGNADDSLVSVTLKLHAEDFPASSAAAALGADDAKSVDVAFFRHKEHDRERNSRFLGVKWIDCEPNWEAKHRIAFEGFEPLRCDKVNGVKLKPRSNGRFDARFTVIVLEPPANFMELLAERYNRSTKIVLEHDAELELKGGSVGTPPKQQDLTLDKPVENGKVKRAVRKETIRVPASTAVSDAMAKARAQKAARDKRYRERQKAAKPKAKRKAA